MQRDEALQHLHAMLAETAQTRDLTAGGQAIPAIRALLRAKRLGKQSIAGLLGSCLRAATKQADDASISRLIELIGFAQQALCPGCRSEVGKNGRRRMMCESNVWVRYPDGQTEKVADDVLYAIQEGEEVVLRWFLKEPLRVVGRIVAVDAVKHTITLDASGPPGGERFHSEDSKTVPEHVHPHPHPR